MKRSVYPRLALDGIRKNRRMYLPYIITCIGMAVVFYIMAYLTRSATVAAALDSDSAMQMLGLGKAVIMIFAVIFLFYTHSFLIRRRKREFGLYNILGMTKGNIARVLFWEELYVLNIALAIGVACGILISKLAELLLVNLIEASITYTFIIEPKAILDTAILFIVTFALQYIKTLLQIRRSGAINLLKSEAAGEKPPRANWVLAIIGALLLGAGYYVAVTVVDPFSAIQAFFIAVLLVIGGTYFTMISGSVALCRALQKKKNYYYKSNHFVSVSQMAYRMRRNGAGLATICILSTMVLVIVSSTSSLYFGKEDSLANRYPQQFQISTQFRSGSDMTDDRIDAIRSAAQTTASGATEAMMIGTRTARIYGAFEDGGIVFDPNALYGLVVNADLWCFTFITADDYNAAYGTSLAPGSGEAIIHAEGKTFDGATLNFAEIDPLRIIGVAETGFHDSESTVSVVPTMLVIVNDFHPLLNAMMDKRDSYGEYALECRWICGFDTQLSPDAQVELNDNLRAAMREITMDDDGVNRISIDSSEVNRRDFYDTFGALFFIGIMLSIVFMFAAVLIIYYKQISEAYEDQARYEIMRRVGMSDREIRHSINSQLLTVFYLPLVGALMHICFAFPVIRLLLRVFNLNNAALFAAVTGIAFVAYAAAYALTYKATSSNAVRLIPAATAADGVRCQ